MTYMDPCPSSEAQPATCKNVMKEFPRRFCNRSLQGQSRNLCLLLPSNRLFERVDAIYSYDAPGLNRAIIETKATGTSQTFVALSPKDPSSA